MLQVIDERNDDGPREVSNVTESSIMMRKRSGPSLFMLLEVQGIR